MTYRRHLSSAASSAWRCGPFLARCDHFRWDADGRRKPLCGVRVPPSCFGGADDGATVLDDVYKSIGFLNASDIPMFAVGFIIMAFIVALIAIKTFLQLIKRISFIPFAIYRFVVAARWFTLSSSGFQRR